MQLNTNQQKAVDFKDGPCLVMAGAGSGKTRVLTNRIIKLIENGVSPHNILAITFTNKAANEMKERIEKYFNVNSEDIFIGTFHSFGMKIIRENYQKLGFKRNINILDADDVKSLIKKNIKKLGFNKEEYDIKHISSKISNFKNNGVSVTDCDKLFFNEKDSVIKEIYKEYTETLNINNSVDFDDLLILPVELLKKDKEVLERYQNHYKYILVDEYQDTNSIQYDLCRLLSKKYNNIFVVGDMNQSIYAWRNADYKNMLKFMKDYKGYTLIKLDENYRSTNNILKVANSVIKNNPNADFIDLWSSFEDGDKIEYIRCDDEIDEATTVTNKIMSLLTEGYSYNDIAVLYRTNAQSRVIEEKLVVKNIPYNVYGSYYFYNRKEIKDLIAYLNLIYNSSDSVSLERVINTPKRGIGEVTISKIRQKAYEENISMFDAIDSGKELEWKNLILNLIEKTKNKNIKEIVEITLNESGLKKELEDNRSLENDIKLENLEEFVSLAITFEDNGIYDLESFLQTIMLVSDKGQYKESKEKVSLMTIHSAKGLEFKIVFITGMEEGVFPHFRSIDNKEDLEEERRLCYVAITRAKTKLYLLNAKKRTLFGKTNYTLESRFIKEMDSSLLDIKNEDITIDKIPNMYNTSYNIKPSDKINHTIYGEGVVISINGGIATIAFKNEIGIKQIAANHKSITLRE